MKKNGRSTDQALLRTTVNKKMQTFAHKRLVKDLQEIENQKIPTVGVTARPLEQDLFVWHGNIRGPEGTPYQGGVFHVQLLFPQSYPHHPPTVTLFTTIPHPNVFGNFICLDMIQYSNNRNQGQGWSSAYSAQSVLTQLQSFLFEQNLNQEKATIQLEIKKAVKSANEYKCCRCKHGGRLSCWPPFTAREQVPEEFITLQSENELIFKGLVCYHTKLPYTQNQLGLGLRITKVPRTGNIREAEAFYDYISVKAFIKESVNYTSNNERITHWFPVYFGDGDNEDRFQKFLEHAMSMIMTNSTRNFKPDFIIEVMPKLILTTIYHIMSEKKHPSIRLIRVLTHLHSTFLYCLQKFPQIGVKLKSIVQKFLESEEARNKENQSNLGCILAYLSVLDTFKFADVAETYFLEQLDRQVLWILKAVPQLLDDTMDKHADELRSKVVFKSQMTSFHIFCFYKLFITFVCEKRKSRTQMWEEYKSNLCKLTNKEEDQFQRQIIQIQKKVLSFDDFFKFTGLKHREQSEIRKMLKQAIKSSERKKYHGDFQLIHQLPKSQEQFKKLLDNVPSYRKYIEVTTKESMDGDKKSYAFDLKEKVSKDEDWRAMCIQRWSWIKEILAYDSTLTARDISLKAINYAQQGIAKPEDRLIKVIKERYLNNKINYNEPSIPIPQIDWKKLFLRLDLEDFLLHIDMNPDFKDYYQKLEVCRANKLNTILIPFTEIHHVKSGYFYLTVLLTKLTTLKYVEFSGLPNMSNIITQKAAKAMKKGFTNFITEGGRLQILSYYNLQIIKDLSDSIFTYICETDSLTSLRFSKVNFFCHGNGMKVVSNALSNLKDIQQIQLVDSNLNEERCKVLADSLMRMKKLKIFTINDRSGLGQGLSSIIYNLAFSPNLLMININQSNLGEIKETIISISKLLKISASIEILKASTINNLNQNLQKEFWTNLGQCRSLRVLDLSNSGDLSTKKTEIGMAIAFNAKKKGILEYFNMIGTFHTAANVKHLYQGMNISEYDEEKLYGDPNKVSKMIPSNYKKVYYNNLKAIQFDYCQNMNPTFTLSHYNKLLEKKDPEYVKLIAQSPNLQTLALKSTGMQKNFAEILVLALDPRRPNFVSKIKVLNLSTNNLGKDGIKALGEVLPHNNILQVLDLSKNQMGVSGASQIADALKDNKSLKYLNLFNNKIGYDGAEAVAKNIVANNQNLELLEIGHNRIRDKGLKSIVDALVSNQKSGLKILGLRFNFLTTVGITYLYNKLSGGKTKIQELFVRNNLMDDLGLYNLQKIHTEDKSKITIDLLGKVKYLEQEKSQRTVWIHPITGINLQNLKKFFENTYKCGIVLDIRVRRGRKYPNKVGDNLFGFVEFADATSVTRALHVASRKLTIVDGVKFRIYKAGTGTFSFLKKTSKQKKLECALTTLPVLPYGLAAPTYASRAQIRGSGRGRGRGRGRSLR